MGAASSVLMDRLHSRNSSGSGSPENNRENKQIAFIQQKPHDSWNERRKQDEDFRRLWHLAPFIITGAVRVSSDSILQRSCRIFSDARYWLVGLYQSVCSWRFRITLFAILIVIRFWPHEESDYFQKHSNGYHDERQVTAGMENRPDNLRQLGMEDTAYQQQYKYERQRCG
jgi:hypothetical protein